MKNTITKEELNMYLERLDTAIKNDIEDIKKFDRSDIIRLEKAMLLNLRYLKKYDTKILKTYKKLTSMYEKEVRLTSQINYTKEIVIDESESAIIKSIIVLTTYAMISSHNIDEFIRKIIVLLVIDALTFNFNLVYFTSDERKKLVARKLAKLKINIVQKEINYKLYTKINHCFTLKLDTQYDKLLELCPEYKEIVKTRRRK